MVGEVFRVGFVGAEVRREGKGTKACSVKNRTAMNMEWSEVLVVGHGGF
jgi:hypothetical protein